MPRAWTAKRERQFDHIKSGLRERGENEEVAEEVAARTVNKERARNGESKEVGRTSTEDISSGRRGGLRSHSGRGGRTAINFTPRLNDVALRGDQRCRRLNLSEPWMSEQRLTEMLREIDRWVL